MTVFDLIRRLEKLSPELEVLVYTEDDEILGDKPGLLLLDILDVVAMDAARVRADGGRPSLRLGKGTNSSRLALLEVTADL